jgi:hypothetical protein
MDELLASRGSGIVQRNSLVNRLLHGGIKSPPGICTLAVEILNSREWISSITNIRAARRYPAKMS